MAGFNYGLGRSNNMVAAEASGKITIGRWAKRHKVSAAAAGAVMQPCEAHHTGTGRPGKSRLTPVIQADREPTADQLARMQEFDRAQQEPLPTPVTHADCVIRWVEFDNLTGAYGRIIRRNCVPREVIERGSYTVEFCRDKKSGELEINDKRCGLVVVQAGGLICSANINIAHDDVDAIAARLAH